MQNTLRQFAIGLTALIVTGCSYSGSVYTDPNPPSLTNGLWIASAQPSAILHLTTSQFGYGGTLTLATTLTTASAKLTTLVGLAFDSSGDLWVASQDDSLLIELAPAALGSSGSAAAIRVIRPNAGSLSGPTSLAFDAEQRLWVANRANGTLVRFDPDQLAAGGAAVPAVILSGLGVPTSIAFDAAGALWVSDSHANTLSRYSAEQLAASGSPVPAVVLSAALNSLVKPSGLAFDASGTLWVANTNGESVAAFSPDQLSASGAPEPRVLLSFTGDSPTLPVGLAFDGDGNLWVVGGGGVVAEFARASLGVTGAPEPSGRFQLSGYSLFWNVAFWPKPAGLPLN